MDENWLPGRSVGHKDSDSGSLGLFVDVKRETKIGARYDPDAPMIAFVSAAHVLAPPYVKTYTRDPIHSPCPPFAKRLATNRKAELVEYVDLRLSPRTIANRAISNDGDLAIAALQDAVQVHNLVPKPVSENGSWKAGDSESLGKLVGKEDLEGMVKKKERVFKIGRRTNFTTGILAAAFLPEKIFLTLPDGSPILYENLCKITS